MQRVSSGGFRKQQKLVKALAAGLRREEIARRGRALCNSTVVT